MQKPYTRMVCQDCGNSDVAQEGKVWVCKNCKKKVNVQEMTYMEQLSYKKELQAMAAVKKFSWQHCDEIHALWFIIISISILLLLIWLA